MITWKIRTTLNKTHTEEPWLGQGLEVFDVHVEQTSSSSMLEKKNCFCDLSRGLGYPVPSV